MGSTFTYLMEKSFKEPRLLILTNPRTDHQQIKDAALGKFPELHSVTLNHQCHMLILVVLLTTKERTACGAFSGCWQGWFCMAHSLKGCDGGSSLYREPEEPKDQEADEDVLLQWLDLVRVWWCWYDLQ
ncbi:hypothetical protein MKW92_030482 [Papaver armeniacum]|nr:hypothetical protein MKW92_030482 [Papaver armeniacum]